MKQVRSIPSKKERVYLSPQQRVKRKLDSYVDLVGKVEVLLINNFHLPANLRCKGKPYLTWLTQVGNDRGLATMIKLAKAGRLYVTRYLSGQPLMEETNGIKLTNDWLPARLGPSLLKIARSGTHLEKRWLLTFLYSTRSLELPVSPNYESITAPNRSEKLVNIFAEMKSCRNEFWRSIGLRNKCLPESIHFKNFHLTTNMGPNGHGLFSWFTDLKAVPDSLMTKLRRFGGPDFSDRVTALLNPHLKRYFESWFPTRKQGTFRKITDIPDREGKTRTIAIGDYFSQTVLKPFHTHLYGVLRRINQDCTFNQSKHTTLMENSPGPFYSLDLSNATDRFPIDAIHLLLSGYYPQEMMDDWKDIMVGYPFTSRLSPTPLNYAVGNPMGFYSSWVSFAVAHHFVIFICCKRLGMKWKDAPYALLGDDIVISGKALADEYRKVMEDLGVDISVGKTHVSEHTYEFAKQWIHKGSNISPFSIGGWRDVCNRYNLSVNFLQNLATKGWIPTKGIVGVVSGWAVLNQKPGRFRTKLEFNTSLCEIITSVMRGDLKGALAINMLVQLKENRDFEYTLTDEQANYIFQRACLEAFAESNDPKTHRNGRPLGAFAESLVIAMTDERTPFMELGVMPYYVPPLNVYGTIEETYLKLNRLAWEVDTFRGGDWPLVMRSLAIPTSDRAFLVRNKDILPMAAASMGKRIYGNLEEFRQIKRMYPNM